MMPDAARRYAQSIRDSCFRDSPVQLTMKFKTFTAVQVLAAGAVGIGPSLWNPSQILQAVVSGVAIFVNHRAAILFSPERPCDKPSYIVVTTMHSAIDPQAIFAGFLASLGDSCPVASVDMAVATRPPFRVLRNSEEFFDAIMWKSVCHLRSLP